MIAALGKDKRMKIKYRDNMTPPAYGADGTVSDNWDRAADYGGEYVNAHFRIHTPSYDPGKRWEEENIAQFDAESRAALEKLGWTVTESRHSGSCATVRKDKSHLYLHPQDFSGEVLKAEVVSIAESLAGAEAFSLQWVDLYETAYDMTDTEYFAYLDGQEKRIRAEVLKVSKTTRRTRFYRDHDIACHVAGIVRLRRVGEDDGRYGGAGKTANHIVGVIDKLIDEGLLATAVSRNGSRLIRAVSRTEQKEKKQDVA